MNLALNREYPDPDEAKLIEEMVKVAVERMKPQQGRIRRGQHAKATGCVQDVDSPTGRAWPRKNETMAFSPWNALAEHRPMGASTGCIRRSTGQPGKESINELVVNFRGRQEHVVLFPI